MEYAKCLFAVYSVQLGVSHFITAFDDEDDAKEYAEPYGYKVIKYKR